MDGGSQKPPPDMDKLFSECEQKIANAVGNMQSNLDQVIRSRSEEARSVNTARQHTARSLTPPSALEPTYRTAISPFNFSSRSESPPTERTSAFPTARGHSVPPTPTISEGSMSTPKSVARQRRAMMRNSDRFMTQSPPVFTAITPNGASAVTARSIPGSGELTAMAPSSEVSSVTTAYLLKFDDSSYSPGQALSIGNPTATARSLHSASQTPTTADTAIQFSTPTSQEQKSARLCDGSIRDRSSGRSTFSSRMRELTTIETPTRTAKQPTLMDSCTPLKELPATPRPGQPSSLLLSPITPAAAIQRQPTLNKGLSAPSNTPSSAITARSSQPTSSDFSARTARAPTSTRTAVSHGLTPIWPPGLRSASSTSALTAKSISTSPATAVGLSADKSGKSDPNKSLERHPNAIIRNTGLVEIHPASPPIQLADQADYAHKDTPYPGQIPANDNTDKPTVNNSVANGQEAKSARMNEGMKSFRSMNTLHRGHWRASIDNLGAPERSMERSFSMRNLPASSSVIPSAPPLSEQRSISVNNASVPLAATESGGSVYTARSNISPDNTISRAPTSVRELTNTFARKSMAASEGSISQKAKFTTPAESALKPTNGLIAKQANEMASPRAGEKHELDKNTSEVSKVASGFPGDTHLPPRTGTPQKSSSQQNANSSATGSSASSHFAIEMTPQSSNQSYTASSLSTSSPGTTNGISDSIFPMAQTARTTSSRSLGNNTASYSTGNTSGSIIGQHDRTQMSSRSSSYNSVSSSLSGTSLPPTAVENSNDLRTFNSISYESTIPSSGSSLFPRAQYIPAHEADTLPTPIPGNCQGGLSDRLRSAQSTRSRRNSDATTTGTLSDSSLTASNRNRSSFRSVNSGRARADSDATTDGISASSLPAVKFLDGPPQGARSGGAKSSSDATTDEISGAAFFAPVNLVGATQRTSSNGSIARSNTTASVSGSSLFGPVTLIKGTDQQKAEILGNLSGTNAAATPEPQGGARISRVSNGSTGTAASADSSSKPAPAIGANNAVRRNQRSTRLSTSSVDTEVARAAARFPPGAVQRNVGSGKRAPVGKFPGQGRRLGSALNAPTPSSGPNRGTPVGAPKNSRVEIGPGGAIVEHSERNGTLFTTIIPATASVPPPQALVAQQHSKSQKNPTGNLSQKAKSAESSHLSQRSGPRPLYPPGVGVTHRPPRPSLDDVIRRQHQSPSVFLSSELCSQLNMGTNPNSQNATLQTAAAVPAKATGGTPKEASTKSNKASNTKEPASSKPEQSVKASEKPNMPMKSKKSAKEAKTKSKFGASRFARPNVKTDDTAISLSNKSKGAVNSANMKDANTAVRSQRSVKSQGRKPLKSANSAKSGNTSALTRNNKAAQTAKPASDSSRSPNKSSNSASKSTKVQIGGAGLIHQVNPSSEVKEEKIVAKCKLPDGTFKVELRVSFRSASSSAKENSEKKTSSFITKKITANGEDIYKL